MLREVVQAFRHAVPLKVVRRCADEQMHGEELARDQPLLGRRADPKTHVGAVEHPVADVVVEVQGAGDLVAGGVQALQGPLQHGQGRQGGFQ